MEGRGEAVNRPDGKRPTGRKKKYCTLSEDKGAEEASMTAAGEF